LNAELRTDESFSLRNNPQHHLRPSPLENLMGMVSQFPFDYMHLVCLGVMRRLLNIWVHGPSATALKKNQVIEISGKLLNFRSLILYEFSRKLRSLKDLAHWKATEYRLFLLYIGPCALEGILPPDKLNHFMLLHVAMSILTDPFLSNSLAGYADALLHKFVQKFSKYYPAYPIVYNIHSLVHLSNDVKKYGHLDNFSCFSYESYLGKLKKLIRGTKNPLKQVAHRLHEKCIVEEMKENDDKAKTSINFLNEHHDGLVPISWQHLPVTQYEKVQLNLCRYSTIPPDNCIQFGNSIGLIQNILKKNVNCFFVVRKFSILKDCFNCPCQSSRIYVYEVEKLEDDIYVMSKSDIVRKYMSINMPNKTIVAPLRHNICN